MADVYLMLRIKLLLNKQFQSVFTDENLSNIPNLGVGNYSTMPGITFSTSGIQCLLNNLDTNKAYGPCRSGVDPGFSERGSEYRGVSLKQGVWGRNPPVIVILT